MSINLGHHISDLLYEHDCVIVPDLGGFVANAQSASISVQAHTLVPPSKQIGFNQNLIQNDGLLANALVQKEGLEYNEAVQQLLAKAHQYKDDLKQGRRVELLKVGVLYRDRSGNVRFVPNEDENHLKTSFGLGKLYLVPLGTEVEPIEVAVKEKETPVVPITTETTEKRTRQLPLIVKVAAVFLPLLLVGGWLLKDEISNAKNTNFASFNPFTSTTIPSSFAPRFEEEGIEMDYPADENTIDVLADSNPDLTSVYFSFEEDKLSPDGILVNIRDGESEEVAAAIPTSPKATAIPAATKMKMWFIVGGAFRKKSNADNMASSLQDKGYEAYIFEKKNDLHLVCYGSYTNKQSANQALTDVRTNENKQAWLKKH